MTEEQILQLIREEVAKEVVKIGKFIFSDRYLFNRLIQLEDGRDIQTGRGTGSKIATASDQKLGFWGVTPVDQPETVDDPSGGVTQDGEARQRIIAIIDRLQEAGIIK